MEPMIDITKNGFPLYQAIEDAGHVYYGQRNNIHYVDDAVAVNVIVQSFDEIPGLRAQKRQELKIEAIKRISNHLDWIKDIAEIHRGRQEEVAKALILMIQALRPGLNEAALNTDMQNALAILDFVYGTALPWINNAARTVNDLKNLDIANHPGWP